MDEENNLEEGQEKSSEENNRQDYSAEFASLKAELESLKSQQFASVQAQTPKEPSQIITIEQANALKDSPEMFAKWMQMQAETAKNEIRKESSKQIWDKKTEEKFPLINTDKEFKNRVSSQMREMVTQGEYTKDDPMLLYRAAQIAASEYTVSNKSFNKGNSSPSSVDSRHSTARMDAPKVKIDDNDPRVQFAKVLGIKGDKLIKFKAQLGPYVTSQRRQVRRLSK